MPRVFQALALVAGLVLGLAGAGALALRWRTQKLGDALVSEFTALAQVDPARAPHRLDPGALPLARGLEPHLPGLSRRETEATGAVSPAGCLGRPEPRENRECLAATAPLRDRARELLAATRTAVGDLPEAVVMDRDTTDVAHFEAAAPLARAVKIAALEVAERAAAGKADAALDTCADALALARDQARMGGYQGGLLGSSWIAILRAPCAAALDAASRDAKVRFAEACERFAAQWPTGAQAARSAAAHQLFHLYGDLLTDAQMRALPRPAVRNLLRRQLPSQGDPPWSLRRHAWVTHARALALAVRAADTPDEVEAQALLARAKDVLASSWHPRLRTQSLVVDEVLDRTQRARVLLALLGWAARADSGEAPRLGTELLVRSEGGGRAVRPRQARWASHETVLTPDGP